MLGLGPGEILFVALVIIVVVGPDRLPQFMRTAGRMYGKVRRAADEMRRSLVLEADRQDAEHRYQEMKRLREQRLEKTPEVVSDGAVSQKGDPRFNGLAPADAPQDKSDGDGITAQEESAEVSE